jgi:hypothetical protein
VASPCEYCNEPSVSVKGEGFIDSLSVLLATQEGLCFMERDLLENGYLEDQEEDGRELGENGR